MRREPEPRAYRWQLTLAGGGLEDPEDLRRGLGLAPIHCERQYGTRLTAPEPRPVWPGRSSSFAHAGPQTAAWTFHEPQRESPSLSNVLCSRLSVFIALHPFPQALASALNSAPDRRCDFTVLSFIPISSAISRSSICFHKTLEEKPRAASSTAFRPQPILPSVAPRASMPASGRSFPGVSGIRSFRRHRSPRSAPLASKTGTASCTGVIPNQVDGNLH